MTVPLEKILTVSARDYCDSINKPLSDYELRGVIVVLCVEKGGVIDDSSFNKYFIEKIPKGTEIVVSFNYSTRSYSDGFFYAGGTALVPKRKGEENVR